ncbi:MAG: lactate dehydrogenase [Lachnospiraceae bacterium]|nr:lactate dehydrogenase [Lachnospiraceae bacterium]
MSCFELRHLSVKNSVPAGDILPASCAYKWLAAQDGRKLRLQAAGLGDVGRTMLIGLLLAGIDVIESIGIYDLSPAALQRMEIELNQVAWPCRPGSGPRVYILREEELFQDCDAFFFCATKAIPEVGSGVQDVRMAQYEANKGIVALYAAKASQKAFRGLFGVVSDPVDLLCQAAFLTACKDAAENGGRGLHPEQIQGFGLGVMFARASYYAAKDADAYPYFKEEGRAFGPHGKALVVADSIDPAHYDPERSRALTEKTVQANLEVRALGFKPYIAPALSSAALTILAALRGEWNDSARYLNGLWFGARNRTRAESGCTEWEADGRELPEDLYRRLEKAYRHLESFLPAAEQHRSS